eukprot:m.100999 g.100999  ORF g.100999 m.100999 type:complete len:153 (-) comp15641_c0_seq4:2386-2844(-)
MAAKVTSVVRMYIPAGMASKNPPLGPALGQRGINIVQFCKDFNERTKTIKKNVPIPTAIEVKSDRTFSFTTGAPPNSYFLLQAAGVEVGSAKPNSAFVGVVSLKHIYEMAVMKAKDPKFVNTPLKGVCESLIGSARSMGIRVVRDIHLPPRK